MALLSTSAAAETVVIYGSAKGLWSPTHPHVTRGKSKAPEWTPAAENSPVLYTPPEPEPVVEPEPEVMVADVCPTIQSAPHLCQDF